MESLYLRLLRKWCDGMLRFQLQGLGGSGDGALYCPSCKLIHGRCPDAVYPLMCLADRTGEEKYLEAARKLFAWHENLICDDGSVYNDANSQWNGITVFAAVNLHEALVHHGHLLTGEERRRFEERMRVMGQWVSRTIGPDFVNNINYIASSAAAGALIGQYFGDGEMVERARKAAGYVLRHVTENGLLYGEGLPHNHITARGCRPVDIGYNVEESVGMLIRYALAVGDGQALDKLTDILRKQLEFMLPDGAWDNSFGTRAAKWTYWGSRTSDGCQAAYGLLAHRDPAFAQAAYRNTKLMERCTFDGLLYGGPDYRRHGELPCIHHTISHGNGLAAALDAGIESDTVPASLPCDRPEQKIFYFPEIDTYKVRLGKWRATVTGYDFWVDRGHASGGTMTLLWHEDVGVLLLSSVVDYRMLEPFNMQLTLKKGSHRPLTPRLEKMEGGKRYSFCYDTGAKIEAEQQEGRIRIVSCARLVSLEQEELQNPVFGEITYTIEEGSVQIEAQISGAVKGTRLVVPVIADRAKVFGEPFLGEPENIFFLTGGFCAREFVVEPDEAGRAFVRIEI